MSGLALIHLLLTPCLAQPGPPILDLRFENTDAASGPTPYVATAEGMVTGDVHGRLVTRVLERVPISPSEISVKAQMLVYDSSEADAAPLLVTEIAGNLVADQNSILSGTVLRAGWPGSPWWSRCPPATSTSRHRISAGAGFTPGVGIRRRCTG